MTNSVVLGGVKTSKIIIKKETAEWIGIWLLLFFSFINVATLAVSMILSLLLLTQREIGAIKILNIITLRTVINPGLAVNIGRIQNLKWGIIFLCSFYLISGYKKIDGNIRIKLNKVLLLILVYGLYTTVASFITSTLPIVAIFKLISYVIAFLGIIIGVFQTSGKIDWLNWMNKMFMFVLLFSIPLISNSIGYLRNGHAFQGITNQPNMFGIILALFFAIILTRLQLKNVSNRIILYTLLGLIFYLGILSKSRTSTITMIVLLIIYITLMHMNLIRKIFAYYSIGILTATVFLLDKQRFNDIQEYFLKGKDNLLYSRADQIDGLVSNFNRNPLFGSGFSVPVTHFRSYAMSSEYLVEPGNLILSVLSYGGILGLILFLSYILAIFQSGSSNYRMIIFLFLSPILISMGEMVFFSSNNIGIWLYMMLGIYLFQGIINKVKGLNNQQD